MVYDTRISILLDVPYWQDRVYWQYLLTLQVYIWYCKIQYDICCMYLWIFRTLGGTCKLKKIPLSDQHHDNLLAIRHIQHKKINRYGIINFTICLSKYAKRPNSFFLCPLFPRMDAGNFLHELSVIVKNALVIYLDVIDW